MNKKTPKDKAYESIPDVNNPTSVFAHLMIFEGDIKGAYSTRIDGQVNGNISIKNTVIIGKSGVVNGNVKANNVVIAGEIIGNVKTGGLLYLLETAIITGDVISNKMVANEGSIIDGNCKVGNKATRTNNSEETSIKKFDDANDDKSAATDSKYVKDFINIRKEEEVLTNSE